MVGPGLSVLVLYENFAVAAVVLRRLLDIPMVHMVRAESGAYAQGPYDVVVVDPYLRAHRRTEAMRRWAPAPVIELRDMGGGAAASVVAGEGESAAAHAVLAALCLEPAAA
jgi:hypothetical protein